MMRTTPVQSGQHQPRAGYSLVEMLVVITIIALMATLAFSVIGASGEAAREAATKSSIRVISGALRERVDAFQEATSGVVHTDPDVPVKLKNRLFRSRVQEFLAFYGNAGNTYPITPVQAEAFVRKEMFKAAFPQQRSDMYGMDGIPQEVGGVADDSPLLNRMYTGTPSVANRRDNSWVKRNLGSLPMTGPGTYTDLKDSRATESSELLYLILTDGDVFGLPPSDITGIDRNLVGDTDKDGNLEFLDGWGHPLVFYNWPTRLIKDDGVTFTGTVTFGSPTVTYTTTSLLMSNLPAVSSTAATSATVRRNRIDRDPDDPLRSLTTRPAGTPLGTQPALMVAFSLQRGSAASYAAMPFTAGWYHDANTASQPLIVSAGPDGELGLYLPSVTTTDGVVVPPPAVGVDHLARVIHTQAACEALGDNITNQQRGPQ